jgi:N6-adenosine-specific RNA methylase IME4
MPDQPFAGLSPPYGCIVADPPWPSMHQRATYHRGKPERHYQTMTVEDIAALPVRGLADVDAHLWIWGVNRLLGSAYDVARAWGFTPISLLTWCKNGPGMGYYLRNNTEHCLLATRGKPMVPAASITSSWFIWPRGRHSEKPAASYELIGQVSPGPYVELFARRLRLGWDSWGHDVEQPGHLTETGVIAPLKRLPHLGLRYPGPEDPRQGPVEPLDDQGRVEAVAVAERAVAVEHAGPPSEGHRLP